MKKVLIFSDLHIAKHKHSMNRLEDCLNTLEWVFKTAVSKGIKHILFCGDLFHDRQKIDVQTYQKTFELFEKYVPTNNIEIYLLLGNHDLWHMQRWDISSVIPLRSIKGVTVVDKPCTLDVAGHPVSFLPYTHNPAEDLKSITNNADTKILCGHVAIDGAVLNTMHQTHAEVAVEHDGDMIKVGAEIFDGWDHVFLGHYHGEQKLQYNVEYIGSPLQLSFGEAFQHKHVLIFDLETHEKEYIRNTFSPTHLIIRKDDVSKYELANNFIWIMVEDISQADLIDLRTEILSANTVGSIEFKSVEKKVEETLVEDAKAIMLKEGEMLEKYVESQKSTIGELKEDKLLEIGRQICNAS